MPYISLILSGKGDRMPTPDPSPVKLSQWNRSDPDSKADFVNRIFWEVAPGYDRITRLLSLGRDQSWKRRLIRSLPPLAHPHCLDLACGTGDLALALARKYPGGTVVGLDANPAMLEWAGKRPVPPRVRFVQGDMSRTGFAEKQFDVVTGGYALRNAREIPEALAEIRRVLKPGGWGAFLDFSKSPKPWLQTAALACLVLWGGFWGLLLHGNPDLYTYIPASLRHYPDREALKKLVSQAGFQNFTSQTVFFGFAEILVFQRPPAL